MLPQAFLSNIDDADAKLMVFSAVRNELLRLPAFLEHYRTIGIHTFAILDNGSTDGTFEYLSSQPDVVLMRSVEPYAASAFGMNWLNELHRNLRPETWVLYVDADELIVYDDWPERPIADLVMHADAVGASTIQGFMLDMYPDGPLDAAHLYGDDLFAAAPLFDSHYYFRTRPVKPWEPENKAIEVIGGPRLRLFSNFGKEVNSTWIDYTLRGQIDRLLAVTPDAFVPALVRYWPKQLPALTKVPLVKSGGGFQYATAHNGSGGRPFDRCVILCHFKFLSDFDTRVRAEVTRGEHYRRGAEYMMYLDAIKKYGCIDLRYEGSTRFESARQLADLNFLRNIAAFH